jgi:hypothetical protein
VNEHGQVQPARLGHEHLGRGRGDQPVEQDDGAVWDAAEGIAQGRERCGSRPGPAHAHGVLVHRPAERGELVADPAVIEVASTRPGGVVDAGGHDDVDRSHRGRS